MQYEACVGVVGDRIGQRRLLAVMRGVYAALASLTMLLALTGRMTPVSVFVVATAMALVRTSDIGVRTALIADMMPPVLLTSAIAFSRTTSDVARITGALAGASLFALIGVGLTYVVVTIFYLVGLALTLAAGRARSRSQRHGHEWSDDAPTRPSALAQLREGLLYIRRTPHLLAGMWLAVLVNFASFPLSSGLMPYIAREVYRVDKIGLGVLIASFATGAFAGSLTVSALSRRLCLGRTMIQGSLAWNSMLLVLSQTTSMRSGMLCLAAAGFAQSTSMVSLAAMLVRTSDVRYRGRVMGVRALATYSLPIGLLLLGWMIVPLGFATTAALSAATALAITLVIALIWRRAIWPIDAPANQR